MRCKTPLETLDRALLHPQNAQADRLELCLCIHAALKNRLEIPRVYLPAQSSEALKKCILANIAETRKSTIGFLGEAGLAVSWFRSLSPHETSSAIVLIEGIIADFYGEGDVHYEVARFTPFSEEDVATMPLIRMDDHLTLKLNQRSLSKTHFIQKFKEFTKTSRANCTPIFSAVVRDKANQRWQDCWMSENAYADVTRQERIIGKLGIGSVL